MWQKMLSAIFMNLLPRHGQLMGLMLIIYMKYEDCL
jgi:hypothetical protein